MAELNRNFEKLIDDIEHLEKILDVYFEKHDYDIDINNVEQLILFLCDYDCSKYNEVKNVNIEVALKTFIIKRTMKLNELESYKKELIKIKKWQNAK